MNTTEEIFGKNSFTTFSMHQSFCFIRTLTRLKPQTETNSPGQPVFPFGNRFPIFLILIVLVLVYKFSEVKFLSRLGSTFFMNSSSKSIKCSSVEQEKKLLGLEKYNK